MHRATPPTFVEPLIHGLDAVFKRMERLLTGDGNSPRSQAVNHERDLVNLPGVTEQVAQRYQKDAGSRSVHLIVDVAPDALVIGDPSDLRSVVAELILTAVKMTPDGGCVTISGEVSHGVVTLAFCSFALAAELENPDQNCEACRAREGRHISSESNFCPIHVGQILRAHGGRMDVSKKPGDGSRFVVRLPVA